MASRLSFFLVGTAFALTACGSTTATSGATTDDVAGASDASSADAADAAVDVSATSDATVGRIGSCTYTNLFSKGPECKGYTGTGWTADSAAEDCKNAMGGPGKFASGVDCAFADLLGTCTVQKDGEPGYVILSGGSDSSQCANGKLGCETFAGGTFAPGKVCAGTVDPGTGGGGGYGSTPFVQPHLDCKDPLPGEPAGNGPGGKVCTNVMISGCTEFDRHFEDYGVCADVLTQRPYWAAPASGKTDPADPRLKDPVFMAELTWSKQQIAASACVCCHTQKLAPNGASNWAIDRDDIWLDEVKDSGIAMLAGLADSTQLGAYPAKDNNGFDRTALGIPTTDVPRMQKFLLAEWTRRGHVPADGKQYPAFGGPLVSQAEYVPDTCAAGEGVAADGKVNWQGGDARYVYILSKGAKNPGVPPNLDVPDATVWHVNVPTAKAPLKSGIAYGVVTGDMVQRVPATGAAPALVKGETYYLYTLLDVGFPGSRCLFTAL